MKKKNVRVARTPSSAGWATYRIASAMASIYLPKKRLLLKKNMKIAYAGIACTN
jgi:hypothetical protein